MRRARDRTRCRDRTEDDKRVASVARRKREEKKKRRKELDLQYQKQIRILNEK